VSAEDVMAIQQIAVAYADALNRGSVLRAVSTYVADGRLETPAADPAIGHEAITAAVAEKIANLELIFQTVHLGLVVVDGDRAEAQFPITEWARRAEDSRPFLFLGWYDDVLVRTDQGWRFSRRRLVPRIFATADFVRAPLHPL